MEKEFSKEFLHDITDLIGDCVEHDTDNVDLVFTFNNKKLKMNIIFSVETEESQRKETKL